jgi:hypothetical protein
MEYPRRSKDELCAELHNRMPVAKPECLRKSSARRAKDGSACIVRRHKIFFDTPRSNVVLNPHLPHSMPVCGFAHHYERVVKDKKTRKYS